MKSYHLKLFAALFFATLVAGCGGKTAIKEDIAEKADTQAQTAKEAQTPEAKTSETPVTSQDLTPKGPNNGARYASLGDGDLVTKAAEETGILLAVHFDYDKYNIKEDDKPLLSKNAKWLGINPDIKIRVEGYADERGETEYNLALGDKRAKSVIKYLEDLGVSKDRLSAISYGEENPIDKGHDESAWSKNRRAEFRIMK